MTIVSGLGGGYAQASATGAYSGPWAIETQRMYVQYSRVPTSLNLISRAGAALSGTTSRSYGVGSTSLLLMVYFSYSKTLQYGNYATSAEEVKQRFGIVPTTTDQYGVNYGVVSAGILGVAGVIDTSTPYYSRRAWTSTDVEVNITPEAAQNYICPVYWWDMLDNGEYGTKAIGVPSNGDSVQFDWYRSIDKHSPDTLYGVGSMTNSVWLSMPTNRCDRIPIWEPLLEIQGAYNLGKEDTTQVPYLLDLIGEKIKHNQMIRKYQANPFVVTGDSASINILPEAYTGTSYYEINRHQYD